MSVPSGSSNPSTMSKRPARRDPAPRRANTSHVVGADAGRAAARRGRRAARAPVRCPDRGHGRMHLRNQCAMNRLRTELSQIALFLQLAPQRQDQISVSRSVRWIVCAIGGRSCQSTRSNADQRRGRPSVIQCPASHGHSARPREEERPGAPSPRSPRVFARVFFYAWRKYRLIAGPSAAGCGSCRTCGRTERAHKVLGKRTERVFHSYHRP